MLLFDTRESYIYLFCLGGNGNRRNWTCREGLGFGALVDVDRYPFWSQLKWEDKCSIAMVFAALLDRLWTGLDTIYII